MIVVTGAGDKAFASGADISEFGEQRTSPAARARYDEAWAAVNDAWASVDKPVIAMIRGFCVGRGLLTALQADIRIASDDSQFGIPAARLGLGYAVSGVTALMNLIGPARTAEVLFSARLLPAAEALQMGLVNQVVPADHLRDAVLSLAAASLATPRSLSPRPKRRSARPAGRKDGGTWPGSRRWSRLASVPRTISRASALSPKSARRPSPAGDRPRRA